MRIVNIRKFMSMSVILTMISLPVLADGRHWHDHDGGWGYGGYWGGVVVAPRAYYPPPVVYAAPPPVYYAPPPVVYAPPPVVYAAPPVAVMPAAPGLSIGVNIPLR